MTQETIKNCFKHAFFDDPKTAPEIDFTEEWNKLKQITTISYMTFNDYLNIDAHALPYKQMNEEEIVELVKSKEQNDITSDCDDYENELSTNVPSSSEAFAHFQSLQIYFAHNSNANEALTILNNELVNQQFLKLKQ